MEKEQSKPKANGRKDIIKIGAGITKVENNRKNQ